MLSLLQCNIQSTTIAESIPFSLFRYVWRAMRPLLTVGTLLIATQLLAFSQSSSIRITGVVEPPELTGEPKQVKKLTETQRQFGKIVTELKDEKTASAVRPNLTAFIETHPNYSDAFFLRAECDLCMLHSRDYVSILRDVEAAISTHAIGQSESMYDNLVDQYSMRGKLRFALGKYRESVDDLERAMKIDLRSADRIFNISGVEPDRTSPPCSWSIADLDLLNKNVPNDYRISLFRGLYFRFFTTFKEDYYPWQCSSFRKRKL